MRDRQVPREPFEEALSSAAALLLSPSGSQLIADAGQEALKGVLLDLFCGVNLRDSTEPLTRQRLSTLSMSLTKLFVQSAARPPRCAQDIVGDAAQVLSRRRLPKEARWLAQWLVGLTGKAKQNILRDSGEALKTYAAEYVKTCREAVASWEERMGPLSGTVRLSSGETCALDWLFLVYLMNAVGAGTLTIRGSEKSRYGKLFERLVLGSLLEILGFRYAPDGIAGSDKSVFWLASPDEKRESDATVLSEAGIGARFDIGFIGPGNPEISLDKVTRFEQELVSRGQRYYMATIIIVDRLGPNSRVPMLAERVGGTIVQMSMAYWPRHVAQVLRAKLAYEHRLADMPDGAIRGFLQSGLQRVDLGAFAQTAP